MLSTARAGRLLSSSLSRSIRAAPSLSSTSALSSQRIPVHFLRTSKSTLRPFSAFSSFHQQAAAYQDASQSSEVEGVQHAPPELTKFSELAEHGIINRRVIDNIARMNIVTMTDVQRMTINECLDGSDVIGQAKTGTGKTLAFLMPIIQRMLRDPGVLDRFERPSMNDIRAVIISPTRELAEQIAVEANRVVAGTRLVVQTAVGGTQKGFHLRKMQREGCHILVGTPGRLQDLLSDGYSGIKLDNISTFVLDEADRLLDIGFAPAIEEIQSYMPPRDQRDRQTLMFSATVPRSVVDLVRTTLRPDFKFIRTVDPDEAPTHTRIPQKMVYLPGLQNQIPAIVELATKAIEAHKADPENNMPFKAVIFANSQNEIALLKHVLQNLRDPEQAASSRSGMFTPHPLAPCQIFEMYSKLTQQQRNANTEGFRRAQSGILCASDVAARGMDFPNVSHVIQLGIPKSHDDYVHRIGRTGRAGKNGQGLLMMLDGDQRTWQREFSRDLNLQQETGIFTATMDMTQGQKLPGDVARILQMVEAAVKTVPFGIKSDTYRSLLGVLKQDQSKRSPDEVVEIINNLSRYGWGLETPPKISSSLAAKLGFSRAAGLEIGHDDGGSFGDRGSGGRGGFGGQRGGRGGFDQRDPFGSGSDGRGVSRGYGGGERGGFGGDRGGFGERRGGGFGGERRSGGFGGDRGGFGERRGGFGDRGEGSRGGFGRSSYGDR